MRRRKIQNGSQTCHSVKVTPCLFYPPGVSACVGCLTERDSQSRPVSMCLFSCWTDDSLRCLHLISCWLTVPPWPQGVSTWVTHTHKRTHTVSTPLRRDAAPSAAAASRGKWEWDQRRRLRTCCLLGGTNRTMPCVCARVSQVTWRLPQAALQLLRHQSIAVAADDSDRDSWKHFLTTQIKSHKVHMTLCPPRSKMSLQRLGHVIKFPKENHFTCAWNVCCSYFSHTYSHLRQLWSHWCVFSC